MEVEGVLEGVSTHILTSMLFVIAFLWPGVRHYKRSQEEMRDQVRGFCRVRLSMTVKMVVPVPWTSHGRRHDVVPFLKQIKQETK
jgi:hypothetical protein